jgi:hypothetical protein
MVDLLLVLGRYRRGLYEVPHTLAGTAFLLSRGSGLPPHRLGRAVPGNLRGDRRDAVAKLVERQIVGDDVDQAPERRRGVLAVEIVAVLDVLPDQRVRLLVLGAQIGRADNTPRSTRRS